MENWVIWEEGQYLASRAVLINTTDDALELKNFILEIYKGRLGRLQMRGKSLARNFLIVELLEAGEDLDLLLDFGTEHMFRMITPMIQAGKIFAPNIESVIHIFPKASWEAITPKEFEGIVAERNFLSP